MRVTHCCSHHNGWSAMKKKENTDQREGKNEYEIRSVYDERREFSLTF